MSQMDNKDVNNILNSLSDTSSQISEFLNKLSQNLTPEQKEALDKELSASGGFNAQMNKVQSDMAKAMNDIDNFNKQK